MKKITATINPYKYCNRTSIDGAPPKKGQVLVPIWIQNGYKIPPELKQNLITWHFGEFKFRIGFMPQPIENYETYMEGFQREINDYLAEHREGRCVIGHKPNGEPICCPESRLCTGCAEKYDHERYNPLKNRFQTISLDYCYENENFDYADENAVDPEEYMIAQEEETDDEVRARALAYLEKKDTRHAQIIRLELEGKTIEEICVVINLKSSCGREVINEANDALCDCLKMPHLKTKHRK